MGDELERLFEIGFGLVEFGFEGFQGPVGVAFEAVVDSVEEFVLGDSGGFGFLRFGARRVGVFLRARQLSQLFWTIFDELKMY